MAYECRALLKKYCLSVCRQSLLLTFVLYLLCSSMAMHAQGGIEKDPIVSKLSGATMSGGIPALGINAVAASAYTAEGETSATIQNVVSLSIKEMGNRFVTGPFTATIAVRIDYGNTAAYGNFVDQTFVVDYKPGEGQTYNARSYFSFDGAKFVKVTVTNISGVSSDRYHMLLLENEIRVTQFFNLASNAAAANLHTDITATTEDELNVKWDPWLPGQGVTHTQLEWTWVEAEMESYYNSGGNLNTSLLFTNNATRIDLPAKINEYTIPKLYDADPATGGKLYYRIRAVNIKPNGSRADGVWSEPVSYNFNGHESALNWQVNTSFAEEGKRNTVIEYFDGSLRARQTVTKDNSTNTTIASETFYDGQGRPAIQILPVPGINQIIKYQANLNLFNTQAPNTDPAAVFDLTPIEKTLGPGPAMQIATNIPGASLYYSPQNPEKDNGFNKFIPDAKGFPYVQTQYTPDGTGRVLAQSGVGPDHRIGSGHETKYYYTSPAQEELDGLFGTEVGDASHYFKNMVSDANGQMSVSYVDMHGRTIATALAGEAPGSLDALPSASSSAITRDLLNGRTNILTGNIRQSVNSIAVPAATTYNFEYTLAPGRLELPPCEPGGASSCFNFLYDLEISITDESGDNPPIVLQFGNVIPNPGDDCGTAPAALVQKTGEIIAVITGNKITFSKQLTPGSYTIRKTLSLNQHSLQQYADLYATKALCKTREALIEEIYQLIKGDCDQPSAGSQEAACTACVAALGNEASFRTAYLESIGLNAAQTQSPQIEAEVKTAFLKAKDNCDLLCNTAMPASLRTIRELMLLDMKPFDGQYAREWDPNSPPANTTGWSAPLYYKYDIFSTTNTGQPFYRYPRKEDGAIDFYRNESGVIDGTIYGTDNPPSGTLENISKTEFAEKFKDSWADALLYRHPEFPKLQFAETTLRESYAWIDAFTSVNSFTAAQVYFPGGAKAVPAQDPFYILATPASQYLDVMTAKVTTNAFFDMGGTNGWLSMWQVAYGQVKCKNFADPNAAKLCMVNAPVVPPFTGLTTEENEMVWKSFRGLYANERRKDINKFIAASEPLAESDALIAQKYRLHFPETDQQIASQGNQTGGSGSEGGAWNWWPTSPNDPPAGVNLDPAIVAANQYESQCDSYIDLWKNWLRPCVEGFVNSGNSANKEALIESILTSIANGMKQVCIAGSDAANPYGSSTVPPGYTGPAPASFEAVIHQVFTANNIPKSALCNPFVIEWPKPYGKGPKVVQSYTSTVDACACDNFAAIKTEATTAGYNPASFTSLNEFLQLKYRETLTETLYNALQNCNSYKQLVCEPAMINAHCDDPEPCTSQATRTASEEDNWTGFPPATCEDFERFLIYYFDRAPSPPQENCQSEFVTSFNTYFQLSPAFDWNQIASLYYSLCNKTLRVCENCIVQVPCGQNCEMKVVPFNLTTPQPMPAFLKCGYTGPRCVTCKQLSELTASFKTYFTSTDQLAPVFGSNNLTDAEIASNILFAKYLNYHTGFQFSWADYAKASAEAECNLANYTANTNALQNVICGSALPATDPTDIITVIDPCQRERDKAIALANEIINERIRRLMEDFNNAYLRDGLSTEEKFSVSYDNKEYHYTLYYYDMAGSLVKTVPPAGIRANFTRVYLDQVKIDRAGNVFNPRPHELVTQYRYNSLGQVVSQNSPDGGTSHFWYDALGRLVVSQNAEQEAGQRYSYTLYDLLGRITEVGEKTGASAMTQAISQAVNGVQNWLGAADATRKDVTSTIYDQPYGDATPILKDLINQEHLRNRVSYSVLHKNLENLAAYQTATFYTYDIHGNVDRLVQDFKGVPGMQTDHDRYKLLAYDYDLISGKVNMVSYQPDLYLPSQSSYRRTNDKFFHRYKYDAQNRLTEALTSRDKIYWESDARYAYYKHGPLARTEYGQLRVQGVDYAYTLQGWLKGVNSTAVSNAEQEICPPDAALGSDITITNRSQYSQPLIYRAQQVITFNVGFESVASDNFEAIVDPNSIVCTPGSISTGSLVKGDMGGDGSSLSVLNGNVAPDVFGFSLNYYNGDYSAITSNVRAFATGMHNLPGFLAEPGSPADPMVTGAPLFNGNIASMMVSIPKLGISGAGSSGIGTILYGYRYDQLNRLVGMNAYKNDPANTVAETFSPLVMKDYKERISYDPNGNILSYLRNGTSATAPAGQGSWGINMDQLTYKYQYVRNDNSKGEYTPGTAISDPQLHHLTNRLSSVDDAVTATDAYKVDIDDQAAFNYTYDRIGNLISDTKEHISHIEWNVYGKINSITKDNGSVIEYLYDVSGNRISKTVTPATGSGDVVKTTIYARDASGNVMAVYERVGNDVRKTETHLYGSSRIGMATEFSEAGEDKTVQSGTGFAKLSIFTRHEKLFELSNHLGNVLVTVSDVRIPYCPDPNTTVICGQDGMGQPQACHCSESPYSHFYKAEVVSANDYYPFGMGMVGRSYSSGTYRYGFNGQENDNEVKGEGNQQDYGMRIYDPRLGRFLSVDPITKKYPELTPYQFASNTPLWAVDLDGLEALYSTTPFSNSSASVIWEFSPEKIDNIAYKDISPWMDLLTYKTSKEVMQQARQRVQSIMRQPIENAVGDATNLDYYSVIIDELPTNMSSEVLYQQIRQNFGDFKRNGGSELHAYNSREKEKWLSNDPVSAVMSFDVFMEGVNVEDMSVVTSKVDHNQWIFTPVWTLGDGGHPLAGNRQFGLTSWGDGKKYTFFTRGVDRPEGNLDNVMKDEIFTGADKLWNAVMTNVVNYINQNGGKAKVGPSVSKRLSWEEDVKPNIPNQ